MRWEIETWRKLYTRVDARWLALDVSTRGLADELIKYADDAGYVDLDIADVETCDARKVADAIGRLASAKPHERTRMRTDVARLLEERTDDPPYLVRERRGVRIRNFAEAQDRNGTKRSSAAQRQARYRERHSGRNGNASPGRHALRHEVTDPVPVPVPVTPLPPEGAAAGVETPEGPIRLSRDGETQRAGLFGFELDAFHAGIVAGVQARDPARPASVSRPNRFASRDIARGIEAHCPANADDEGKLAWVKTSATAWVHAVWTKRAFTGGWSASKWVEWLDLGCPSGDDGTPAGVVRKSAAHVEWQAPPREAQR